MEDNYSTFISYFLYSSHIPLLNISFLVNLREGRMKLKKKKPK